jgi:hypothetical protein
MNLALIKPFIRQIEGGLDKAEIAALEWWNAQEVPENTDFAILLVKVDNRLVAIPGNVNEQNTLNQQAVKIGEREENSFDVKELIIDLTNLI